MGNCLFKDFGIQPKKIFFIPVKDKNGNVKDKFLRVVEGGGLHKKLIEIGAIGKGYVIED